MSLHVKNDIRSSEKVIKIGLPIVILAARKDGHRDLKNQKKKLFFPEEG